MAVETKWISVGAVLGAHGLKGAVRIRSFTEDPLAIGNFDRLCFYPGLREVRIASLRKAKGHLVAVFEGIEDREEAEKLKGLELVVSRAEFSEPASDEFYLVDLEGLAAVDENGRPLGKVASVYNFGAEDMIELALIEPLKGFGEAIVLPFRKSIFPDIRLDEGRLTVALEEWLRAQEKDEKTGPGEGE